MAPYPIFLMQVLSMAIVIYGMKTYQKIIQMGEHEKINFRHSLTNVRCPFDPKVILRGSEKFV